MPKNSKKKTPKAKLLKARYRFSKAGIIATSILAVTLGYFAVSSFAAPGPKINKDRNIYLPPDKRPTRPDPSRPTPTAPKPETPACPTPSVPGGLSVKKLTKDSATLVWSTNRDRPEGKDCQVTGYSLNRDGVHIHSSSSTSYTDTNLKPNKIYSYRVRAVVEKGSVVSALSSPLSVKLADGIPDEEPKPDIIAPTTPAGLRVAQITADKVSLTWGRSSDTGGSGFKAYMLYRDGQLIATKNTTASTTYADVPPQPAEPGVFQYYVKAQDNAGNTSAASNAVTADFGPGTKVAEDKKAPSTPQLKTVEAKSPTQVYLQWSKSTDDKNGSGLATYRIWRNHTRIDIQSASATSYTDKVNPDSNYTYYVVAQDKAGNWSGQSNQKSVQTPKLPAGEDTQAPSTPGAFSKKLLSDKRVELRWKASTDNVGVSSYVLQRSDKGDIGRTSGLTLTDEGLADNTPYIYSLYALDAAGNRSALTRLEVTYNSETEVDPEDKTGPGMPGGLHYGATPALVELSWDAPKDKQDVTAYRIFRDGHQVGSTTVTSFFDTDVVAGRKYTYQVLATDASGNLSAPATIKVTVPVKGEITPDTREPREPLQFSTLATGPTEVKLIWSAGRDDQAVAGYNLYVLATDGSWQKLATVSSQSQAASLQFIWSKAKPKADYTLGVQSFDAFGNTSGITTSKVTTPAKSPSLITKTLNVTRGWWYRASAALRGRLGL